eukprot:TRINITY_DN1171_c1_g1_i1.p1 TRINITY_DN1171_c1_g1~~TRINITY_DN1171_c1_g1_i1.p1  ORF type:complete len:364 (+),score=116.57 TRINITY_DN1171_c1_g1_i1:240-1331(+)
MAQSVLWRHLSSDDWSTLKGASFQPALIRQTCVTGKLGRAPPAQTGAAVDPNAALHESQDDVLTDLAYYTLKFANQHQYSAEKASTFFSIVMCTHEEATERNLFMEEAFHYFKDLLMRHSIQRPPFSVQILSFQDVHDITQYMTETYFRHYRMYQYAFTRRTVKDVTTQEIAFDEPRADHWPPLSTAVFEEDYHKQLAEEAEAAAAAAAAQAEADAAKEGGDSNGAAGNATESAAATTGKGKGGKLTKAQQAAAAEAEAQAQAAAQAEVAAAAGEGEGEGEEGDTGADSSDDEIVFSEADRQALAALPSGKVQSAVQDLLEQQLKAVKKDLRASIKARESKVQEKLTELAETQASTSKPHKKK